jgi:cytochrome b
MHVYDLALLSQRLRSFACRIGYMRACLGAIYTGKKETRLVYEALGAVVVVVLEL